MQFTNEWFTSNIPLWKEFLVPLKDAEIHALEIGSFEGKSALWLLDNVLTNPESELTCVDAYEDYDEMKQYHYDWKAIKNRFIENTSKWKDKVRLVAVDSTYFLKTTSEQYDLIYIDGNHAAAQVLLDAVLSHLHLRKGGLIIFDDYLYGGIATAPSVPKGAIDAFMACFAGSYEPLSIGYQVILKKC